MESGPNRSERLLTFLLRVGGVATCLATFAIVMPEEWMVSTHERLGLGAFPAAPLTSYLTRSLSAMYAFHGVILLALSFDVRRYRRPIVALGWATFVMGAVLLGIDLDAPMPVWWTLLEGPPVMIIGLAIVWLSRSVES